MTECWVEIMGDVGAIQEIPTVLSHTRVRNFTARWAVSSDNWDAAQAPKLIGLRDEAHPLIEIFNEARALTTSPANIIIGPHVWETDGHLIVRQDVLVTTQARLSVFLNPVTAVASVDGRPAEQSVRLLGDRLVALQTRERNFQRATAIFASCGESFPALWIVWEYIRAANGGHKEVVKKGWATVSEMGGFAETADFRGHRHSLLKAERPGFTHTYQEMPAADARALVQRLLRCWLDEKEPLSLGCCGAETGKCGCR